MKNILTLFIALFSLFISTSTVAQTRVLNLEKPAIKAAIHVMDTYQKAIFFFDDENQSVFIDFTGTKEKVVSLQVLKSEKDLYFDDVSDMKKGTIYEISMVNYETGYYTIAVTAASGITFCQSFKR